MRKKISYFLICTVIIGSFFCTGANAETENDAYYSENAVEQWYVPQDVSAELNAEQLRLNDEPVSDSYVRVECDSWLSFTFTVPETAGYYIAVSARLTDDAMAMDTLLNVQLDGGETEIAQLQLPWSDIERGKTDRKGNDVFPEQQAVSEFTLMPLLLYTDIAKSYIEFPLEAGKSYTIRLSPTVQPIEINKAVIYRDKQAEDYSPEGKEPVSAEPVIIEAEKYAVKSDSYIRSASVRDPSLTPYDTYTKRLNVVDGGSWKTVGQKILWEFEIEEPGYYKIALHCKQNTETNKSVFRRIEIDGSLPFSKWDNAQIKYTSSNGYKNVTLQAGGEDAFIYLDEGKHTLAMTVTMGSYAGIYNDINGLMTDINELGMALLRITSGSVDKNRTWDMESYMPDADDKIKEFSDRAKKIYSDLAEIDGRESVWASDLETVSEKLDKMLEEPELIPNKIEDLSSGDNSAAKFLGNILSKLSSNDLTVDRIYLYGDSDLPREKASFFESLWESLKRFVWSFLPDAVEDYNVTGDDDGEELEVWVGQSAIITDILQQIVDENYNTENNTDIKLVVLGNEQKLVLANAAGVNPDMVLSSGSAFTFACRGALKNLLDYDDFINLYNEEYQLESLVSTSYGDGVYGAVDSRNFNLLFYRKDILSSLGLEVPDTWDDVRAMMPTLLRNQMNFYIPISTTSAMKSLSTTAPYIFQNGGEIYDTNGATTAINSPEAIDAITEMTEFYRIYGMEVAVSSFYNSFRYGEIPIGIGDFNMYLQLTMAAPELAGRWGVALTPGTKTESGEVLRYQPASATASFIFANTDKPDEAWDFLKWWLSDETQLEFSTRRSTIYGPEYQWNTANIKAFEQLPFDATVRDLALEQWKQQREVIPHPASYIVERELSGVWSDTVIDNKSMIESLDNAVIAIDRELKRKLQEYGYINSKGELIKDYNVRIIEMLYDLVGKEN